MGTILAIIITFSVIFMVGKAIANNIKKNKIDPYNGPTSTGGKEDKPKNYEK